AASERQICYYTSSWHRRVPSSYSIKDLAQASPSQLQQDLAQASPSQLQQDVASPRPVPHSYRKTSTTKYNMARLLMLLILVTLASSLCMAADCNCDYHRFSCVLSQLSPPGKACKCVFVLDNAITCTGIVQDCKDPNSLFCKYPGLNYPTCQQGQGECAGYGLVEVPTPNAFCVKPSGVIDSTQG
ncbi:unnamed protein product, partial [Meganyctiphanes norvegica]